MKPLLAYAEGFVTAYLLSGAWLVIICDATSWSWQFKAEVVTTWPWMLYVIAQAAR